jgi:ubiquitin C-terminal hydrolase
MHGQADAMEFFTFLLDHLHEEMRSLTDTAKRSEDGLIPTDGLPLQDADDDGGGWNEVCRGGVQSKIDEVSRVSAKVVNATTPISRVFHGTMRCVSYYQYIEIVLQ